MTMLSQKAEKNGFSLILVKLLVLFVKLCGANQQRTIFKKTIRALEPYKTGMIKMFSS